MIYGITCGGVLCNIDGNAVKMRLALYRRAFAAFPRPRRLQHLPRIATAQIPHTKAHTPAHGTAGLSVALSVRLSVRFPLGDSDMVYYAG